MPLQLLLTTATINTPSSRLHQPSRTHHHASDHLWEARLPPSGMTPTFVGRLITLRLTPTLILTHSTGYEKSWRYLYKIGEVKGLMCENVPPSTPSQSSRVGPYGAYELDDWWYSHLLEYRGGEGVDELLEMMLINVEREKEMNRVKIEDAWVSVSQFYARNLSTRRRRNNPSLQPPIQLIGPIQHRRPSSHFTHSHPRVCTRGIVYRRLGMRTRPLLV